MGTLLRLPWLRSVQRLTQRLTLNGVPCGVGHLALVAVILSQTAGSPFTRTREWHLRFPAMSMAMFASLIATLENAARTARLAHIFVDGRRGFPNQPHALGRVVLGTAHLGVFIKMLGAP